MADELDAELAAFEAEIAALEKQTVESVGAEHGDGEAGKEAGRDDAAAAPTRVLDFVPPVLAKKRPLGTDSSIAPQSIVKRPMVIVSKPVLRLSSSESEQAHDAPTSTTSSSSGSSNNITSASATASSAASLPPSYHAHSMLPTPSSTFASLPPPPVQPTAQPHMQHAQGAQQQHERPRRPPLRAAAGTVWRDEKLLEFPSNDFRIFVGDLGPEVTDAMLTKLFSAYPSFAIARVVLETKKGTTAFGKSRGYGFVSFLDAEQGARAMRELNGKYCGNRPMKLKKSSWQKRNA